MPNLDAPTPDLLQHAVIIVLIVAGGIALGLAATHSGVAGLPELAAAITCWGLAWHLVRVGRVY